MPLSKRTGATLGITAIVALFIAAGAYFYPRVTAPTKAPAVTAPDAPSAPAQPAVVGWRADFSAADAGEDGLPAGWKLVKKPGTKPATFTVEQDPAKNGPFLRMEADRGSASLITVVKNVDLRKTPVLRWKWRVEKLPAGADGRVRSKDDQAIGIYVGTGSALNNKSVSYRWDTETPPGTEGTASYGLGGIKIKWFTLRNKEDAAKDGWITEERNVAEDFKSAWGFYPDTIYISVSCNSQYTRSQAEADLGEMELVSPPSG